MGSGGFRLPGTTADVALADCFLGPENTPEEILDAVRQPYCDRRSCGPGKDKTHNERVVVSQHGLLW